MYAKRCATFTLFVVIVVIVGLVNATENYMDYGEEIPEKTPAENIHELYRLLLQRNTLDNGFGGIPPQQLMLRKSLRSALAAGHLRYGRSGPHISARALSRPLAAAGYDDNN
ncbi:short neuropeptide F isoform X2 [Monomorium pharaonis]|uniref:short neuropeptide F isoform X2 n=1 Tax=Monomorium pharaonis TaxID=307658 RepID=UPI00063F7E69|nr:short neuropeptide F isoform X2 [Monomorium pharaonis]